MSRILVIKHGALGDVVLATGPFAAIRAHHKNDHITLLTTPPYAKLLARSPYFDDIWTDTRPKLYHFFAFLDLIKRLRSGGFTRVYDLQTSERSSLYFKLMGEPRPEWVGTAEGASHRHNTPERTQLHTVERQKQQLAIAGIPQLPKPNLDWLTADISRFALPERYALIVPGGSSHRPGKRWPALNYGALCKWLVTQNIIPVLIGTPAEANVINTIERICPDVINLEGKTDFAEVVQMGRGATLAIGNDTGPMHLIATTGCTCLSLFSCFSNPTLCAPRGDNVALLQQGNLAELTPQKVIDQVKKIL